MGLSNGEGERPPKGEIRHTEGGGALVTKVEKQTHVRKGSTTRNKP